MTQHAYNIPQSHPNQPDNTRFLVLVVEDDLNLLEGIQNVLELGNYDVLRAENGKQALELMRASSRLPDLIVSDIMMPPMDGIELLKEVRKVNEWIKIPFIFLTARSEKSDIQRGKQMGVDDYLVKPFDADELLIAVESRLQRLKSIDRMHVDAMSELKKNILTILNHEFRTPLTFVVAYADLLNDTATQSVSNDEMLTFLKGINVGATRLRRLIENFIQLVEMETGDAQRAYELRRTPIQDPHDLFAAMQREVYEAREANNPFTIEIAPDLPLFIADATYLKTALAQLLDNAIKFSQPDQPIIVGAHQHDAHTVALWVRDQGRGISPEHQAHIWDSFYQINRAVHEDQGAGSGLAIVKGIVKIHGGTVTLESTPDQGSTFTILLPVKPRA